MINSQIGFLTIIDQQSVPYKNSVRKFYICKCVCGKIVTRRSDYINKLKKNQRTVSCGCKHPNKNRGNKSATWRGCGQVSALYLASLRHRAKRKQIDFNITPEYAWEIFQKQNGKCIFTGETITLSESKRSKQIMTASIDRIDSTKGYVIGNIQWVHVTINYMKHKLTNDEFLKWCEKVCKHNL